MTTYDPDALLALLRYLEVEGYDFVPPTPASHARVLARRGTGSGVRDLLGWSRVVSPYTLASALRDLVKSAGIAVAETGGWRTRLRVARLRGRLFLHSAYPTDGNDAVFFGPDSYRFAAFVVDELARDSLCRTVVDIGTGSGAGIVVAAGLALPARLAMTDINPVALALARINTRHAGLEVEALQGTGLAGFAEPIDLALANPPFLVDAKQRAYRHGGDRLGAQLSIDMAVEAAARLAPGGRLLLYTGSAIVAGHDALKAALADGMHDLGCTLRYRELDPDIFGEELDRPAYVEADVERIAAVGAVVTRP